MSRQTQVSLAVAAGISLLFAPSVIRWLELRGRISHLERQIASLKKENADLIEETHRLREDPAYLEEVARKELGFVRPGETVVKFRSQKVASQPTEKSRNH